MALSQRAANKRIKELELELSNAWGAVRDADADRADLRHRLMRAEESSDAAVDAIEELASAHELLSSLPNPPAFSKAGFSPDGRTHAHQFTLTARLVTWLAASKQFN